MAREHPANRSEALRGPHQTAQRAELRALVAALETTEGSCHVVTDSQFVVGGYQTLAKGTPIHFMKAHRDLWQRVQPHIPRGCTVTWIKAHLTLAEALARGFTAEDHAGNEAADLLAGKGVAEHGMQELDIGPAKARCKLVQEVQQHQLAVLNKIKGTQSFRLDLKQRKDARVRRIRKGDGPPHRRGPPRKVIEGPQAHLFQKDGEEAYCARCGKISRTKDQYASWRKRPCIPSRKFGRVLEQGHKLRREARLWSCSECPVKGPALVAGTLCRRAGFGSQRGRTRRRKRGPKGGETEGPSPSAWGTGTTLPKTRKRVTQRRPSRRSRRAARPGPAGGRRGRGAPAVAVWTDAT